jgi:NTP pyrophosphatase (non-canonical NTP hydrolase)
MSLDSVIEQIIQFRDERDWAQFHTVRNLMAALSIEVAELQETVLWKTDEEIDALLESPKRDLICEELADVLIYALLLASKLGENPIVLMQKKIKINASKYPKELARGNARKYTELSDPES